MAKINITIGIPCFNEEENILPIYKKVKNVISKLNSYQFSLLFIDNCSSDKTREKINFLAKKDKNVKGIFFSRNFGQEASTLAMLNYSNTNTNALIILPCDFQDPPELIPQLIKKWEEGYQVVLNQYTKTDDSYFMTFMRKIFYRLFKLISNIEVPINVSGFGLIDRKVIYSLKSLPEKYRFNRGLMMWVGFKHAFIPCERQKRIYGRSTYNFFDYIRYSERGVFGFSYLPLDLITYIGFVLTFLSFLFIIGYLFIVFLFGNPIKASISLMLAIVFFGGMNVMALSIIGKYIEVIVEESKNRPIYIIDKIISFNKEG